MEDVGIRELRQNASQIIEAAQGGAVAAAGREAGRRRRVDLTIAAVAVADNAARATRHPADFVGLEPVLQVVAV